MQMKQNALKTSLAHPVALLQARWIVQGFIFRKRVRL